MYPHPAPRSVLLVLGLLLVVATFAAYAPVAGHGFVNFDSNVYVYENEIVQRGLTLDGVAWAFTTFETANWHPVTWLSIMLDCQLFGVDPGAHHLVNVALHAANALLLLGLLRGWTRRVWCSALVAALFALHPLHVESVAWAAQRKDVLSTFFLLATLTVYTHGGGRPGPARTGAALALYTLGLMAKPMLVSLPLLLLLLDAWPLARTGESPGRLFAEKLPFFALAAAASVSTLVAQSAGGAVGSFVHFSPLDRVANAVLSVGLYLRNTIWPSSLCVFYPYPDPVPVWQWVTAALVVVAITVAAVLRRQRAPYLLVGWLWFLVTLVPVIGLVQVGRQALADRYTYVPHIGLFVALVWGLAALVEARPKVARPVAAAAGLVLAALAFATRQQVGTWRDSVTLYEHALSVTHENATMHFNLGTTLALGGNAEDGIGHLLEAVRIEPGYPRGQYTLGVVLAGLGRGDEARQALERAVALDPLDGSAHNRLAATFYAAGDYERATRHFAAAHDIAPGDLAIWGNLALAQLELGDYERAAREARALLESAPEDLRAMEVLGVALVELGQLAAAEPYLARVSAESPGDARVREMLERARAR